MNAIVAALVLASSVGATPRPIAIDTPMSPPTWALLQRQLLRANTDACREFYRRYFDERGWLLCVERWGGDDGPDDAIENCTDWPLVHALGGGDEVLRMYKQAWEGHLRQYTLARTTQVPFARDGMYYKEFPVMFDWLHNGEGLAVFNLQGLSDPHDARFRQRVRRFAGFYLNDDPDAPNYDPKHKIIRSLFNGSKGPLLRKATAIDWAGDPFEVGHRFKLGHGERSFDEVLAHFKDYNDIIGDHPQNLLTTCLATNAYMLSHEPRYRSWVLEYVDAWAQRMRDNGDIIPTNIGLDGKIGSATGGKWYGGVYGWGFSVIAPQDGKLVHRNTSALGFVGFMNAYLLTGDDRYLEPWRKQIDKINAQHTTVAGTVQYPHMFGARGWYAFKPDRYQFNALELYYLSMKSADRDRVGLQPWLDHLAGKNPTYAEFALRADLDRLRQRVDAIRKDASTPDTRLADDTLRLNPACVDSLVELAMGGLPPKNRGKLLHSRLRYFDPERRRAGLPEDVAALIERMSGEEVEVTLVNVNPVEARRVVIQGGAYGEHTFSEVQVGTNTLPAAGSLLRVDLAAGAGARLRVKMQRYAEQPRLAFPWDM